MESQNWDGTNNHGIQFPLHAALPKLSCPCLDTAGVRELTTAKG